MIKSDIIIYTFTKDLVSNKCCGFELSIYQKILKKQHFPQIILRSASVFNIDNNNKCFLALNQHIRMISEG